MSFLKNQFSNVIEWNEVDENEIFWLWKNQEVKKGSRLIVRPGQDAIFLYNGKIEGIFTDEGNYEVESEIIPFLTTLSSFKFGFNTPLKAEVLFVNQKEFLVRWGTKNPVLIPTPTLKGGMPIRSFGTFSFKVEDYVKLIERVAGVKSSFKVDDVKDRVMAQLDPLLMRWISKEGKDMFNLQVNAIEIAQGMKEDLAKELQGMGISVTEFTISSFSYPEKVQEMIEKTASHDMVGDLGRYQQMSMIDALSSNPDGGMAQMMQSGAGMAMGLQMMNQMTSAMTSNQVQQPMPQQPVHQQAPVGNMTSCSNCQASIPVGSKFCNNCGEKVVVPQSTNKFCSECGEKVDAHAKFCGNCGNKF